MLTVMTIGMFAFSGIARHAWSDLLIVAVAPGALVPLFAEMHL